VTKIPNCKLCSAIQRGICDKKLIRNVFGLCPKNPKMEVKENET
jgi:hypothetical protein